MTIEKRYFWKVISSDGLLKDPEPEGPYYDEDNINNYSGFESEEQAVERFMDFNKRHAFSENSLILVCEYSYYD